MIFIKRKILFFLLILLVTLLLFICNKQTIPTSSIPISNHTIILDAGHGYPDGGATGESGNLESDLNLSVVLKLQEYLESSGATVLLTRSDENGIYDTDAKSIREQKVSDMKNRVKIGNSSNAEIFLSIHMNKIPQKQYYGWQTFYKNNDETSKKIAKTIQNSLNTYMGKDSSREIKSLSGIYLTKNVEIPLVLVECGFLSNTEENKLLQSETYQEKLAWSIYIGLMDYFN